MPEGTGTLDGKPDGNVTPEPIVAVPLLLLTVTLDPFAFDWTLVAPPEDEPAEPQAAKVSPLRTSPQRTAARLWLANDCQRI
jgi:hypothetical protein